MLIELDFQEAEEEFVKRETLFEEKELDPEFESQPPSIEHRMLLRHGINAIVGEAEEAVTGLASSPRVMQPNNVHGFEDEDYFAGQALEKKTDLLKIHLILALQELNLIFGDCRT